MSAIVRQCDESLRICWAIEYGQIRFRVSTFDLNSTVVKVARYGKDDDVRIWKVKHTIEGSVVAEILFEDQVLVTVNVDVVVEFVSV